MLETVCDSTEQIFPGACSVIGASIAPFLDRGLTSVSNWTGTLRRIWTDLEFPVIANELDQITWDNLVQLISEFEKAFGETRVSTRDFSDPADRIGRAHTHSKKRGRRRRNPRF